MTIHSSTFRTDWLAADGANKDWAYEFSLEEDAVVVEVRDSGGVITTFTSNFEFLPTNESEGFVRYPSVGAALEAGNSVRISRDVPYTQPTAIGSQGRFHPEIHETALDRATIQIQQLKDFADRAPKTPIGQLGGEWLAGLEDELIAFGADGGAKSSGQTVAALVASETAAVAAAAAAVAAEAAAEAARDAAEGAAETVVVARFNSKAGVEAATIPAAVKSLQLTGQVSAGDGKAGLYKRVDALPSHSDYIRSLDRFKSDGTVDAANGGYWELVGALANAAGSQSTPSFVFGQNYNRVSASLASSAVFGGTTTQPQHIGKQVYRTTFAGDGVTAAFPVSPGFTVNDVSWLNIRVQKLILSTGGLLSYDEGAGFTVAGYGTGTVTITMSAVPTTDHLLEIVVIGESDDGAANPTLAATFGYDNVVGSIMSLALGAHSVLFSGDGHNSALGGSYHRMDGSYNAALGGQFNWVGMVDPATTFSCAAGQGNRADGNGAGAFGINNWVRGINSWAIGREHQIDTLNNVIMVGRGGKAFSPGEFIHSGTKSTDAPRTGYHQTRRVVLSRDTTDAVVASMTNTTGSSSIVLPAKSAALAKVRVAAVKDDSTKFIAFDGTFLVTKDGAGTALVNNSAADVAVPAVANIGAPTWTAAARGLAGNLVVRVTGAAAENVRWTAEVELVQAYHA